MRVRDLIRGGPAVMGILNVTPDSFSDGGMYSGRVAVEHALEMIGAGAAVIDVGGESTRPGSDPVPSDEEIRRIVPVIRELASVTDVPISVDTMKTDVAYAALDAGADIVNDVYGLRSEGMLELVASAGVPAVIMHMRGMPKTMQTGLQEGTVIPEVSSFLKGRVDAALDAGIREIITDPGFGFGKTTKQNLELVDNSGEFSFGYPVLMGASRKRSLAEIYPGMDPDEATVRISLRAADSGSSILRVHNVPMMVSALEERSHQHSYHEDQDQ